MAKPVLFWLLAACLLSAGCGATPMPGAPSGTGNRRGDVARDNAGHPADRAGAQTGRTPADGQTPETGGTKAGTTPSGTPGPGNPTAGDPGAGGGDSTPATDAEPGQTPATPLPDAATLLAPGYRLAGEGLHRDAIAVYQMIYRRHEAALVAAPAYYLALARSYGELGNGLQQSRHLMTAARLMPAADPGAGDLARELASVLDAIPPAGFQEGDDPLSTLEATLLRLAPGDNGVRFALAAWAARSGYPDQALDHLFPTLARGFRPPGGKPAIATVYLHAAGWLLRRPAAEGVERVVDEALALDPRNPYGWYLKALLRRAAGDDEEARQAADRALTLDPGEEDLLRLKASLDLHSRRPAPRSLLLSAANAQVEAAVPLWSPDGARIALVVQEGDAPGLTRLLLVEAGQAPAPPKLVASTPLPGALQPVAWAPDGQALLLEGQGIWLADQEGRVRQLAPRGGHPRWSPDGGWVSFADNGLWLVHPDGTALRQLTHGAGDLDHIWLPAGQGLIYAADTGQGSGEGYLPNLKELRLLEWGGSGAGQQPAGPVAERALGPGLVDYAFQLSWAAPGVLLTGAGWGDDWTWRLAPLAGGPPSLVAGASRAAAMAYDGQGRGLALTDERVVVLGVRGEAVREYRLFALGDYPAVGRIRDQRLAPDGGRLALVARGLRDRGYQVWMTATGGEEPRLLTLREGDYLQPAWSPDGRQLAYLDGPRLFIAPAE